MKKFLASLAVAVTALVGFAPVAAADDPDTRVTLHMGDGWTDSGSNGWCSWGGFGRDNAGRLIGLSAGHCWASWSNDIYIDGNVAYGKIGTQTNVYNPGNYNKCCGWPGAGYPIRGTLDYMTVVLDETKVKVENSFINPDNGQRVYVDGIDAPPNGSGNYGVYFRAGHTSGVDASYMGITSDQWWVQGYVHSEPGDSGGAFVIGTKLAGLFAGAITSAPPYISTNIESVIADLNTKGSYGAGFTLVNTA